MNPRFPMVPSAERYMMNDINDAFCLDRKVKILLFRVSLSSLFPLQSPPSVLPPPPSFPLPLSFPFSWSSFRFPWSSFRYPPFSITICVFPPLEYVPPLIKHYRNPGNPRCLWFSSLSYIPLTCRMPHVDMFEMFRPGKVVAC